MSRVINGLDMTETVRIEATIPEPFYRAAKLVCDTFGESLDTFVSNALRGELQCCLHNNCEGYTTKLTDKLAEQIEEIAGEEL